MSARLALVASLSCLLVAATALAEEPDGTKPVVEDDAAEEEEPAAPATTPTPEEEPLKAPPIIPFDIEQEPQGALTLRLPKSIPLGTPFTLATPIPESVRSARVAYWRAWSGTQCQGTEGDEQDPPRFATVQIGEFEGQRSLLATVPALHEPWWTYCFEVRLWEVTVKDDQPIDASKLKAALEAINKEVEGGSALANELAEIVAKSKLVDPCTAQDTLVWRQRLVCDELLKGEALKLALHTKLGSAQSELREVKSALADLKPGLSQLYAPSGTVLHQAVGALLQASGALEIVSPADSKQPPALVVLTADERAALQVLRDEGARARTALEARDIELPNVITQMEKRLTDVDQELATIDASLGNPALPAPERKQLLQTKAALLAEKASIPPEIARGHQESTAVKAQLEAWFTVDEYRDALVQHLARLDVDLKATQDQVRALVIGRRMAVGGVAPAKTSTVTERANGFFSSDIGIGWMAWPSQTGVPAGSGPFVFVQLSMSFGQMDFERGIGGVELPPGGSWGDRTLWWLGQRFSLSVGFTVDSSSVPSNGVVKGLFGSKALGLVGAGFRISDFIKANGGILVGTLDPAGGSRGERAFIPFFFGITLDLPVYQQVGRIFQPNVTAFLNSQPSVK